MRNIITWLPRGPGCGIIAWKRGITRVEVQVKIKSLVLGLSGLVVMGGAQATDVRITCTPPTKFTDNTDIGATPIKYNLYGGLAGQTKQNLALGSTSCVFTMKNVAVGTQEYYITAVVGGAESEATQTISVVVAPPAPKKPNAPGNATVIIITVETP